MITRWQELKLGDRVRVIAWPQELSRTKLHQETIDFYERIIATGAVLKVVRLDHFEIPYGELREVDDEGMDHLNEVGLNHGAIEFLDAVGPNC